MKSAIVWRAQTVLSCSATGVVGMESVSGSHQAAKVATL